MAILRETIFNNVVSRFETITVASGCRTNIGANVHSWRSLASLTTDEMPAILIGDTQEQIELIGIGKSAMQERTLTIDYSILISGTDTGTIVTNLRKAQADVEDKIRQDEKWNGSALTSRPKENKIGFADKAGSILVGALDSSFEIKYRTGFFNSEV